MIINEGRTCQQGHILMRSHGKVVAISAKPIVTWFEKDEALNKCASAYLAELQAST